MAGLCSMAPGGHRVLGADARGRCVFFETPTRTCAIHRQVGPEAKPASCRHFPRVVVTDPRGVHVSLSHFCPSAAALLFEGVDPLSIVCDPPAFPAHVEYEGLEARGVLPPLMRPDVLFDWESLSAWEAMTVRAFAQPSSPESALLRLAACAERVRAWRRPGPTLAAWTHRVSVAPHHAEQPVKNALKARLRSLELARAISGLSADAACGADVRDLAQSLERFVLPSWPAFFAPVRRYLAARSFAAWVLYQGRGVRAAVHALVGAWAVLRAASAELCLHAGRALDRPLLCEAFRRTDLLLVHRVPRAALARYHSALEEAPAGDVVAALAG
jgi:hypothetical protein